MSRIGRLPVAIPDGVTVTVAEGNKVTVKAVSYTHLFRLVSLIPEKNW